MSFSSNFILLRLLSDVKNIISILFLPFIIYCQPVDQTFSTPGTFTYTIPSKYSANITVHVFGGGGGGGLFGLFTPDVSAGGGGGGGYATLTYSNVPAGSFTVIVGAGGTGGGLSANGELSRFSRAGYTTITGNGGFGGSAISGAGGAGGTGTNGTTNNIGGKGGNGAGIGTGGGGGGASGSSAGTGAAGVNATSATGAAGGIASGTGNGTGGAGGRGGNNTFPPNVGSGTAPGGGGGGKSDDQFFFNGDGGDGRVIVDVITFLAIQLSSFDVIQAQHPIINWTTLSEVNNDHFSIERSRDGNTFTEIGKVNGTGTSDKQNDYSFTDLSPYKGINYYRIKQVDLDGTHTVFPMKSVLVSVKDIVVYPTLFQNRINIELPESPSNNWVWNMVDLHGHSIQSGVFNSSKLSCSINTENFYSGPYILQLNSDSFSTAKKLIKL